MAKLDELVLVSLLACLIFVSFTFYIILSEWKSCVAVSCLLSFMCTVKCLILKKVRELNTLTESLIRKPVEVLKLRI